MHFDNTHKKYICNYIMFNIANTALLSLTPMNILTIFMLGYIAYRYYIFNYGDYDNYIPQYPYFNKHVPDDLIIQPVTRKTLVLHYLGSCGHSKKFLIKWQQLEEYVETNLLDIVLVKFDMDMIMERDKYNIDNYPKITLRHNNMNIEYRGDYTYKDLANFVSYHTQ